MKFIKNLIILFIIPVFCVLSESTRNIAFADEYHMERIIYSEDYDSQATLDEELFDEESEYEEYDVYTELPEDEDTTEMIVLAPKSSNKQAPVLEAVIEKSYSFRSVEAFHTIWDNSDNFRTIYRTLPSMMQTAPSIIHSANYKFVTDEDTSVYWGHSSLSSFDDISVGFIGKLESSYDSGLKIRTKIGNMNISAGIYDSLETGNPSGGVIISSEELKTKYFKGTFKFGGGVYTNEYGESSSANSGGLFAKYTQGKFILGVQAGKTQYADGRGSYGTSLYVNPSYQLTRSVSIKSKIASHLDRNYMEEELGVTYKPFKYNPNDFSVSLNTSLKNGVGTDNKQTFELKTEFKL